MEIKQLKILGVFLISWAQNPKDLDSIHYLDSIKTHRNQTPP